MAAEYLEKAKYFWRTVDTQSILTFELFSFPHLQPEDILDWVISSVICWALKILDDSWSLFTSLSKSPVPLETWSCGLQLTSSINAIKIKE